MKARAVYDREAVHAILDEAFVAHVGFVRDGVPLVLPIAYVRIGETLYLHGSITNGMLKTMKVGFPSCCGMQCRVKCYQLPAESWRQKIIYTTGTSCSMMH